MYLLEYYENKYNKYIYKNKYNRFNVVHWCTKENLYKPNFNRK